ncbi:MAG: secretion system protein E [Burkholderiales bacterium PBB4]|nr:MAG: secretion system protein E [Burkholderiales bacterium PBB4]
MTSDYASTQPSPLEPVPSASVELVAALAPRGPAELWGILERHSPALPATRHLGEALLQSHAISKEQLREALATQSHEHARGEHSLIGRKLVETGVISQQQLDQVIAQWLGTPVVDVGQFRFDPAVTALIPVAVAEREAVLPLLLRDDLLVVLMADPHDHQLLDELRFMTQRRILGVLPLAGTLMPAIAKAYAKPLASPLTRTEPNHASSKDLAADLSQDEIHGQDAESDVVSESDNTLVRMLNSLVEEAIAQKASDIHIETRPVPHKVRIRLRIDGEMVHYLEVESRYRFAIVARIKIMAGMDISEHRKPQDGKIDFARFGGSKTELRVVTVPTTHGMEDVVLRLLAGAKALPIGQIGLCASDLGHLRELARRPYGLILVCGPTGSGKTTTLHSLISDINTDNRKIWTAEDPIEITQEGLRQVQVNARIGWTFAAAMRTFLRADPDVIMIGEVRDEETARIAIEASLTGHLVLSTLHTNSAAESIARLLEMGLDPFNFSDSLLGILAQRLVRRLCPSCVESHPAEPAALRYLAEKYLEAGPKPDASAVDAQVARWRADFGQPAGPLGPVLRTYTRRGCEACEGRGYKGRLGIYELMLNSDAIRHLVRQRSAASDIRQSAIQGGMKTLRQDGIDKVVQGLTDFSEVLAATNL